jgi:hypothetical protein
MKLKWGTYNFKDTNVHPDDCENLKKIAMKTRVFEFMERKDSYNVLKFDNEIFRIKDSIISELIEPKFRIGDVVLVRNNEKSVYGNIRIMNWHFDKKEYFYFLFVNGKKKSRRYFEEELEKVENSE